MSFSKKLKKSCNLSTLSLNKISHEEIGLEHNYSFAPPSLEKLTDFFTQTGPDRTGQVGVDLPLFVGILFYKLKNSKNG